MTITLSPEVEKVVIDVASQQGIPPEKWVLNTVQEKLQCRSREMVKVLEPRDEWEERLLRIGTPCGVSLSDEAFSRERLYE